MKNGWSPLHCAAYLGYVPIARQLLHKSDMSVVYLRVKNDDNKTALHIAATHGKIWVMKLLVSHYPDCCEQVDVNGNNVLHLFMVQRRFFIKSLLNIPWMNVGALMSEKNVEGQTPLHLLAHSQARSDWTFIKDKKDLIIRKLKRAKARIGPLLWQKAMNKDEDKSQSKRNKGLDTSFLKKASDSHLLVAALVATVSFAAGFTLPGGYKDSDGMAMLSNKPGFKAFVVSDSLALVLSVAAGEMPTNNLNNTKISNIVLHIAARIHGWKCVLWIIWHRGVSSYCNGLI
ncbi:Ankyrin repeat-containing protein [Vitis vinifera]|uniref:Ankyrin repeat-containing protein n=1 Tax=Vitis vinifera TaxID=29760 RepID=A0A438GMF2_VITVI|nr:Ankyrin repeat-containing protein [Vitis vinifera]